MWKPGNSIDAHPASDGPGGARRRYRQPRMYRFLLRPKWIAFTLGMVLLIVTMVNLGLWQLRRLDQREKVNAAVEQRYDRPPRDLDDVLTPGADPDELEWLPVVAVGTYRPEGTIRIVNRSQNGFAGDNIVVPLDLGDGRVLLVNRGFVRLDEEAPAPPSGEVEVTGRLRPSQERRFGQLSDPAEGTLTDAQRVDIPRLQQQVDEEVVGMYIDAFASVPADSPMLEPVVKPDLSEGSHLSYAVQWFIFSVCAAVGWVLAVRHSAGKRQRDAARAAEPAPAQAAV